MAQELSTDQADSFVSISQETFKHTLHTENESIEVTFVSKSTSRSCISLSLVRHKRASRKVYNEPILQKQAWIHCSL